MYLNFLHRFVFVQVGMSSPVDPSPQTNFKEILTLRTSLPIYPPCLLVSLSPNTAVVTIALKKKFTMNLRSYEEISIILKNLSKHSDKLKNDARRPIENLEGNLDDISKVVAELLLMIRP